MPEINLLPDDLRGKEKKELESVKKKPKILKVEMSSPERGKIDQPLKTAKPSLITRLFSRKPKKKIELASDPNFGQSSSDFESSARQEKKVFDIPKVSLGGSVNSSALVSDSNVSAPASSPESVDVFAEEPGPGVGSSSDNLPQEKRKTRFSLFSKKEKSSLGPIGEGRKPSKPKDKKSKDKKDRSQDKSVLELNLIPEELSKYPELEFPKRFFRSGLSLFLTVLIIIGAYLGITWYQVNINSQIQGLEEAIAGVNQSIAQQEAVRNNSEDFQKRISVIEELLNKHVYWTEFFEQLEANTLPQVYYLNFAMTGTEKLVLSSITDSYSSVAEQIVAFEQAEDFVKSVEVSGASAQFDPETGSLLGVNFNLELEFQEGVFLRNNN